MSEMHFILDHCKSLFCLLLSLRYISGDEQWQNLISSLLNECLCAADIVAPVVTSSSPEGFMMDDNEGMLFCIYSLLLWEIDAILGRKIGFKVTERWEGSTSKHVVNTNQLVQVMENLTRDWGWISWQTVLLLYRGGNVTGFFFTFGS